MCFRERRPLVEALLNFHVEGISPFRGKDLFHANDADSRAAFAAKPHTHTHDDRESATGRSRRTSRPLARVPRLARAVA